MSDIWIMGSPNDFPKLEIKKRVKVKNTRTAAKLVRNIADMQQEFVIVIGLKLDLSITNARIISIGGRTTSTFCPASVFRGAILDDASEIILVHNHPGGDLNASKRDKKVLKDSLIVSGKKYRSMLRGA